VCLVDVDAEDEGHTDCMGALKCTERKVLQKGDLRNASAASKAFREGTSSNLADT
jgi:hypothetical protein